MTDGNGEDKVLSADVCKLVPSVIDEVDIAKVAEKIPDGAYLKFADPRLSAEAAEDEPEVRLLRLECGMGILIGKLMHIEAVMPAVCRKIKALEIAVGGLENMTRSMIKKRF